jgi:hypothetical protein
MHVFVFMSTRVCDVFKKNIYIWLAFSKKARGMVES